MPSDHPAMSIVSFDRRDLSAALAIQSAIYPPFLIEDEGAFLSRIDRPDSCCLAARRGEELLGYLLAHRWHRGSPPSLGPLPPDAVPGEVLFIHDLAVSPASRGMGVGQALVARAFALAAQDGLRAAELVAVEGAAAYWGRMGFVEGPASAELQDKLRAYGDLACWMIRDIPPAR